MFLGAIGSLLFNLFKVCMEFVGDLRLAQSRYNPRPYQVAAMRVGGKLKKPVREIRYAAYAMNRSISRPRHWKDKLPP